MRAARWLGLAAAATLGAGFALRPAAPPQWTQIAWPFPRDAWPAGLAFECPAGLCGSTLRLFIRPKRGFCANCDTGVTSDAEVDAVSDVDMMASDFVPVRGGEPLAVGGFAGRQRAYMVRWPHGGSSPALGMAMSRRKQCDLVVAAVDGDATPQAQAAIHALLTSDRVAPWLDGQLDGR